MVIALTGHAQKQIKNLSPVLKKKLQKQFIRLQSDFRHPSLRAHKMFGLEKYEARIDYHFRFTYTVNDDFILIQSIGPHDEGLGKK